jgi:transcriptional regulator with XRE-family HTH domain
VVGSASHEDQPVSQELLDSVNGRLRQQGTSREELARQAGMSVKYLQQVLTSAPDFDPGALLRVATVLGVTYRELFEGRDDPPPGRPAAADRPVLARLTETECWDRLGTHGVGRIALPAEPGPAVFPVNYTVDAKTVLYRTAPEGAAAPETGAGVSFEADRIDDDTSRGWSVLISGVAEQIRDPEVAEGLAREQQLEPWAGGHRPLWVRVRPGKVTGRHITTM